MTTLGSAHKLDEHLTIVVTALQPELDVQAFLSCIRDAWVQVRSNSFGVAVAANGERLVASSGVLERLAPLLGERYPDLAYAADLTLRNLDHALRTGGPERLESWAPPLDGIYAGPIRSGSGESLEHIAWSAFDLCAGLHAALSVSP